MTRKATDANGFYLTRRDQIESEMLAECMRATTSRAMRKALRNVALAAACGERDHALAIARQRGLREVEDDICSVSVLQVLGYDNGDAISRELP